MAGKTQQYPKKSGSNKNIKTGAARPPVQQQPVRQQAQAQPQPQTPKPGAGRQTLAEAEAQRQDARMQRQQKAREEARRQKRQRTMRNVAIASAILLVVIVGAALLIIREANKPGQSVPLMASRPHLSDVTDPHPAYTTDPPTSGPHIDRVPDWRVYTEPVAKELMVHGLEDGGVVISYRPDLDKATVDKLTTLMNTYTTRPDPKNHVVMAPYTGLQQPIVLTAWTRIDRLDAFDEARITRFVNEYAGIDHHTESANGPAWK